MMLLVIVNVISQPFSLKGFTFWQEAYARRCFSLIDEYAPGFSSSVIGYDMLTPPDLEREFGLTGTLLCGYTIAIS